MTDRPPRPALSRDRIIEAAAALADDESLDAVSMRRLAQRLGVVPMAIYKHVADKEELLDGMVDRLIDRFAEPPTGLPWQEAVRHRLTAARRVITQHAWARPAIESRTRRSMTVLTYMDAVAGELRAGGLSAALTHHAMHALGNRIWGFSPELFNQPSGTPTQAPPDDETRAKLALRFPHIAAIAADAAAGGPPGQAAGCDEDFEFDFALEVLLDGFQARHDSGWTRH